MEDRLGVCLPGRSHRFDDSGWCVHGCGSRADGRIDTRSGDPLRMVPWGTPDVALEAEPDQPLVLVPMPRSWDGILDLDDLD